MAKDDVEHFTQEGEGQTGSVLTVEDAIKAHHLATADPEPERDGLMTGPAHEAKYGLERAESSAASWRGQGVHPTENRALRPGEEGYENLRGAPADDVEIETATASSVTATADAPRASRK